MKEQSATLQYVVGIYALHSIVRYVVLNCVLQTLNFHLPRVDYFGILSTRIQIPVQIGHVVNGQALS